MKSIDLGLQKKDNNEKIANQTAINISREFMFAKHEDIKLSWEDLRVELLKFYEKEFIPTTVKNIQLKAQYDKLTIAMKIKGIIDDNDINQNNMLLKNKLEELYKNAIAKAAENNK